MGLLSDINEHGWKLKVFLILCERGEQSSDITNLSHMIVNEILLRW